MQTATKRGVTVDSRAIRSIRNFVTGMAVSSTLIISSNIMAQEVTEDSPFEMNCAGLTLRSHKTLVACSRINPNWRELNARIVTLTGELNAIADKVCYSRNISELPGVSQAKARKLMDIFNNNEDIARLSMFTCNYIQVITADRAANAALRLFVDLFAAPKAQVRCSVGEKNQADCIDTKLSMDDLKGLIDALPVKKKYDAFKKTFDLSYDAMNSDGQIQMGNSLAQWAQDNAALGEQFGQTIVKMQINFTPGATPNSIDLQTINFLKNEIPKMINKTFAPSFE